MEAICEYEDKVFSIGRQDFTTVALDIFRLQAKHCRVYAEFLNAIGKNPADIATLEQIPFLPIQFFKTREVRTGDFLPQKVFESSGTTGSVNSRHLVKNIDLYTRSFLTGFEYFYGSLNEWAVIGLLPSYLERDNSSLVFMVDTMIRSNQAPEFSGFFLHDFKALADVIQRAEDKNQKTLLIGVTFALLDFATYFPQKLHSTIVMETGGMKGRRRELTREEVHQELGSAFGTDLIHAEYGMTELLSQAYSKGKGRFQCPPWMKVLIRKEDDPFQCYDSSTRMLPDGQTGLINVIDLANLHSCSFIATDDIGRLYNDHTFEVLGRLDNADVRGCSLMVS